MTEGVFEETLTKNLLVRCELTASVDSDAQQSAQHLAVDTCSDIEAMTQLSKPEHTLRLRRRAHTHPAGLKTTILKPLQCQKAVLTFSARPSVTVVKV